MLLAIASPYMSQAVLCTAAKFISKTSTFLIPPRSSTLSLHSLDSHALVDKSSEFRVKMVLYSLAFLPKVARDATNTSFTTEGLAPRRLAQEPPKLSVLGS